VTQWPFVGITYFVFEDAQPAGNCSQVADALRFAAWTQSDDAARQLATDVGYVSMPRRIRDAAYGYHVEPATCAGNVLFPKPEELDVLMVSLASGLSGLALLLLLFVIVAWWLATRNRRDLSTAPQDPTEPFVVIFTDIQSSSSLWQNPAVMGPALDLHNEIISRVAKQHGLFTVKTVGLLNVAFARRYTPKRNTSFIRSLCSHSFHLSVSTHPDPRDTHQVA
jgi:hypothetical protein